MRLCPHKGPRRLVVTCSHGMLLWDAGDAAGAKALLAEWLKSCEARGDEEMLAACRANLALIVEETP